MIIAAVAAYIGLSVGVTAHAEIDDHRQQLDAHYRAYVGEDRGDWRVELSVERLASGISFDNVLALAYGVTGRRDFDFGPYTLSLGAGADMLDVQAVEGVQRPVQGSGFSVHGDLSVERAVSDSLFATATLSYRESDLSFPPGSNMTFNHWRTGSVLLGLRREF